MSRTYRRKDMKSTQAYYGWFARGFFRSRGFSWCYPTCEESEYLERFDTNLQEKYKKYKKAYFHRDMETMDGWKGSVASWFRRDLNRLTRVKQARELRKINQGCYEDYSFDPIRKTALWEWY